MLPSKEQIITIIINLFLKFFTTIYFACLIKTRPKLSSIQSKTTIDEKIPMSNIEKIHCFTTHIPSLLQISCHFVNKYYKNPFFLVKN